MRGGVGGVEVAAFFVNPDNNNCLKISREFIYCFHGKIAVYTTESGFVC